MSSKSEKRLKAEAKPSKVTERSLGKGSEEEGVFQVWRAGICSRNTSFSFPCYRPAFYLLYL